jgi:hypothetical protein
MVDEQKGATTIKRRGEILHWLKICWNIVLYGLAIWGVYNLAAYTAPEVPRYISAKHTSLAQSHHFDSTSTATPVVDLQQVQPEAEHQHHHHQAQLDPVEETVHADLTHEHHAGKRPTPHHSADPEQHAHHQQRSGYRQEDEAEQFATEKSLEERPGISGKSPRAVKQTDDHDEHEIKSFPHSGRRPGIKPKRP